MRTRVSVCICSACMRAYTCVRAYVRTCVSACVHVCVYVLVCVCVCVGGGGVVHALMHICTHTCVLVRVWVCESASVHACTCVYIILGLKRVQFFPYRVPQFLIERVIELSSIFSMARMSNLQPTRTHTFSLDI